MNKTEAIAAVDAMCHAFSGECEDSQRRALFDEVAEQVKRVLRGKIGSEESKHVPQAFEEYLSEFPDVKDALIRVAFDKYRNGEYMSSSGIIEEMRADPNICTYGSMRSGWEAYVSRWLVHHFPDVEWGFRMLSIGFLCPWEEGYDEWMASTETDLEQWLKKRETTHG